MSAATQDVYEKILEIWESTPGITYTFIAEELGIHQRTVSRAVKRYLKTDSPYPTVWVRCRSLDEVPNVISRDAEEKQSCSNYF